MDRARRSLILKRAALLLGSTALSLLLAEGALAVLSIGDPILRDVDPVLGWAPIPGAEGWWTREGRAHVQITEHGFRGVDRPPGAAPDGVLRVAVLGDSYTEAKQVDLEAAYFRHAEAALRECVDGPVEVLAFGVSGYGTAQERLLYLHRVRAYHPDVVVLAFLTGNDVADNHPALRVSGAAPYYRLVDGQLTLDASFRETDDYRARARGGLGRWLRRRSRLARLASAMATSPRRRDGPPATGVAQELGLRDEVYLTPTGDWVEAWAWTEAILTALRDDVVESGGRFYVATLSNAVQVDPDPAVRERLRRHLGVEDLELPDRRIAALGAREGFEVLTLAPTLRDYAEARRVQLHGFPNTRLGAGHWNERGHRVAGRALGRWLCARVSR